MSLKGSKRKSSNNLLDLEYTGEGIEKQVVENEEVITQALSLFDEELQNLKEKDRQWLDKALVEIPSQAKDANFRLAFLRAELFDIKQAAKRFAMYWTNKVDVFGEERAFLPMTQDAALKDDLETLKLGYCRAVPGYPQLVFVDPTKVAEDYDVDAVIRCCHYVMEKCVFASDNDTTMQIKGSMTVLDFGDIKSFDQKLVGKLGKYNNTGFPMRNVGSLIVRAPPGVGWVLSLMSMLGLSGKAKNTTVSNEDLKKITGADIDVFLNLDNEKWLAEMKQMEESGGGSKVTES